MLKQKPFNLMLGVLLLACLAGCGNTVCTRGLDPDLITDASFKVGVTSKDDVLAKLGAPSTHGVFNGNVWYYISRQHLQDSFFKPEDLQLIVLAITFNDKDIVTKIDYQKDADLPDISPLNRRTEIPGYETSIGREIFSNIGRLGAKRPDSLKGAY